MRTSDPNEKFVRIPHSFIENYLAQVGPTNCSIYLALLKFADFQTGECFPKIETICKLVGVSRSTVIRSFSRLEKLGLLTKVSGAMAGKRNRYFAQGTSPMTHGYVTHDIGGMSPMTYPNKEELEPLNKNHLTKTPYRKLKKQVYEWAEPTIIPRQRILYQPPPLEDLNVRYSEAALENFRPDRSCYLIEDLVPPSQAKIYMGFWGDIQ